MPQKEILVDDLVTVGSTGAVYRVTKVDAYGMGGNLECMDCLKASTHKFSKARCRPLTFLEITLWRISRDIVVYVNRRSY